MDKRFKMTYLFDIYGSLLTEKQYDVLNAYYNEDYSLSEVAQNEKVSRQAVFDLIKRTERLLEEYDDKMGLFAKYLKNRAIVDKLIKLSSTDEEALKLINELNENL